MSTLVDDERRHLADLLTAVERCVFFLEGARSGIAWPLTGEELAARNRDVNLFTNLSAINERFAKLQDTLRTAMRHAARLAGESSDTFLRVLAYFEKVAVLNSMEDWQAMRVLRNLAAHEYGTNYATIADHFNAVNDIIPSLYKIAGNFSCFCKDNLKIAPSTNEFSQDFQKITDTSS